MDNIQTPTGPTQSSGGSKSLSWLLMLVILAALVLYVLPMFGIQLGGRSGSGTSYAKSDWQAVFLDNGQVYFGKIKGEMSDPVMLRDIYYLQVVQPLQQTQEGQQPAPAQPQLSLVKLGNELHGPMDEMRISRQHVLFVEDLKPEGRVVEAITRYQAGEDQ